jgi:hypothetical protein
VSTQQSHTVRGALHDAAFAANGGGRNGAAVDEKFGRL